MDIKNITTAELCKILSSRSLTLENVGFEHPVDAQAKINRVDDVLNEIKERFENHKKTKNQPV